MRSAFCILTFTLAAGALAQSGTSVIVGNVSSGGHPLAGAAVRIDADVIQSTRVTRTTTRGTYWSTALPPGTYSVTFSHAGTETVTRKAELRIGETVRVDADLPPSQEGESVTMTTITRSIMERPDIESSLEPAVVDDLPVAQELSARMVLAPGVLGTAIRGSSENLFVVDGVYQRNRGANIEIEDAIADAAVISTTSSVEYGRFSGGVILATTRSGGNSLTASLRGIASSGHRGPGEGSSTEWREEATVGGRIIRDALWYFLAAEDGSDAGFGVERAISAKLDASPGNITSMSAMALRSDAANESRASGNLAVLISHRTILVGRADMSRVDGVRESHESTTVHSLIPTQFGDHAFDGGVESFSNGHSAFAGDRWSDGVRWVLSAGARWDQGLGVSPRAGIAYDIAGDGRARINATFARYAADGDIAREAVVGWTQRLLGSGFGRVALVARNYDLAHRYRAVEGEVQGEYLFLMFGGSAALGHDANAAAVWVTATAPAVDQHVTLALLERYRGAAATDVSLGYRFSKPRLSPFAKLDLFDITDRQLRISEDPLAARRAVRLSIGARL